MGKPGIADRLGIDDPPRVPANTAAAPPAEAVAAMAAAIASGLLTSPMVGTARTGSTSGRGNRTPAPVSVADLPWPSRSATAAASESGERAGWAAARSR